MKHLLARLNSPPGMGFRGRSLDTLRRQWLLILGLLLPCLSLARESEGMRTNSLLLNGPWEFFVGQGHEGAEQPGNQSKFKWQPVVLPGPFLKWSAQAANETRYVWARRTFQLSPAQASQMAILRWNRIASGAEAFINGQKVGAHEPTGPYQVVVPPATLLPGENQIVLKIRGKAAVRKSRSGYELIPAGFGSGLPEVTDDVWLDFARGAYMKWVLALPEVQQQKVTFRVTPVGFEVMEELQIKVQVSSWPDGGRIGEGMGPARLIPTTDPLGGEHAYVQVPMPGCRPWTPEERQLYQARVILTRHGELLDEVTFRFGMREIRVENGNFRLNGRNLWLRGSNLVFEWDWGDTITGHTYDYLVTEAREMSMNSFRTHTRPPPRRWCDIGDEYGTLFLAEFPVLFNYQDFKFTPEEWEIWHRNCLLDAAGWMARLWNHPSVIIWVLSNESRGDEEWEKGPFQKFVRTLDPTRPTIRTGTSGTDDNFDVHACGNVTDTEEGNLPPAIPGWIRQASQRTLTCTEYMNYFGHPRTQWTGVDDPVANALAVAQIGAEHTEAMRRARLDGIWPYMYAGWTRTRLAARVRETGKGSAVWKGGFAAPESAAWHSALSPVLASLDLFNPNHFTSQVVTNDLYLINDSWKDARLQLDFLMTRENPEYIPEASCLEHPIRTWRKEYFLPADTLEKVPFAWQLPEEEGSYWLTVRLTGVPGRPVLSQRMVRAVRPPLVPEAARGKTFFLLGDDGTGRKYLHAKGLRVMETWDNLAPARDAVIIWNASRLTDVEKNKAPELLQFAAAGGQVLVLGTSSWNWRELCDVQLGKLQRFSRVFVHPAVQEHSFAQINPAWLIRWNGYPGTVGLTPLAGPGLTNAIRLLWAREPNTTLAAEVPTSRGNGRLLFIQLDLQRRLERSSPFYDPAAEQIFLHLLGWTTARAQVP
ncbi:MAG: hypothetical protein N3J91_05595 [Verrucomicrobiae bacterium]|nr:hypothetical protein [Verrucomicrobiae bacterium]